LGKLGKSNINLLVLAISDKGMAIPLLWKFLTKEADSKGKETTVGKRGNSNFKERKDLMEKFMQKQNLTIEEYRGYLKTKI